MVRLCSALCAFAVSGCGLILDFDPPDPIPGSLDGSVDTADASYADAYVDVDSGMLADAGFIDADASDASRDGSIIDGDIVRDASYDADPDAWIPPDPCDDEIGLCIRYHVPDGLSVTAYRSNMYWTEGGVTVESGWTLESCIGGLRYIDPVTIDCLFHALPVPSARIIYFYPMTAAGAACDAALCPGFPDAWEYWMDGVPVPGTPGVGPVSLERRPTPDGSIMAVRYTTP